MLLKETSDCTCNWCLNQKEELGEEKPLKAGLNSIIIECIFIALFFPSKWGKIRINFNSLFLL